MRSGMQERASCEIYAHKIEQDLAALGQVYARNSMWEQRVQMMKWWADYLDELRVSSAVTKAIA
jgi:hypothetical protein